MNTTFTNSRASVYWREKSTCLHFVHSTNTYWIHYYVPRRIWSVGNTKVSKKKKNMVPPFTKCPVLVVTVKHLGDRRGFTHFLWESFKTFWLENTLSEAFQAFTNLMLIFTHPFLLQLHRWEEIWGSQLDPQNETKTLLFIIIFNFISFYKTVLPSMISHFLYQSLHQITLGYFQKSNLPRNDLKKKIVTIENMQKNLLKPLKAISIKKILKHSK